MTSPPVPSPAVAWHLLVEGNARFAGEQASHPRADAARRGAVAPRQNPFALVVGCSDSRVAAEIVFDCGLGDLFVVRTAGHAVDVAVLGSVEYGVGMLGIPLVVVLGHDSCGLAQAALAVRRGERPPPGHLGVLVRRLGTALPTSWASGGPRRGWGPEHEPGPGPQPDPAGVLAAHVRVSARDLVEGSPVVGAAVEAGRCAVVSARYALADGRVELLEAVGDLT